MKKGFMIAISIILLSAAFMSNVEAASTASISGPVTVRAGDTITVTVRIGGTGILAASGFVKYDSSKLTYVSIAQKISSQWMLDYDNTTGKFLAYDDKQTAPVNAMTDLFTLTFTVKDLQVGTNVEIELDRLEYSDGVSDSYPANVKYSVNIAPPRSTNNYLSSLTVSNATISPSFSRNTTSYTASVPYSVNKLNIGYTTEDSAATVSINNPNLVVGTNTVTIAVTSESGAKRTYTITVTRAQDPNYQASSDARLSEITLSTGTLSPSFKPDTTDYIVYVPYETTKITVGGKPYDSKGQSVTQKTYDLEVGENVITVSGVAENGNKKDYILHIIRMPEFGGHIPDLDPEEETPKTAIEGEVKITGKSAVGETLTANLTVTPEDATVIYTWYSGEEVLGQGMTYNVSKDDIDRIIIVKVTGYGDFEGELISEGFEIKEVYTGITPTPVVVRVNEKPDPLAIALAVVIGLTVGCGAGILIKKRSI